MSSKVVCVTSIGQVGATFLDWSLHWLVGHNDIYNTDQQAWLKVPAMPLTADNAHTHPKNHPAGHGEFLQTVGNLQQIPTTTFHSCYASPLDSYQTAQNLSITDQQLQDARILEWLMTTVDLDYAHIFKSATQCPIIYIHTDSRHSYYQLLSMSRAKTDGYVGFHQWYFQGKLKPTQHTWDQREMLALDIRPNYHLENDYIDFSVPHLRIDSEELWYDPATVVKQCIEYLGCKIDHTRCQHWKTVADQWQDIQRPMLRFCRNLDHIVMATVKGWDFPLPELSLLQEAIIQHHLIYDHNLNIRNWQLESFPDNTNKLHKLLEPNQHATRTTS